MTAAWHGNSAAHAAAGRKGGKAKRKSDPGNWANNRDGAAKAGKKGAEARWCKNINSTADENAPHGQGNK
jgi:general stress protein YciG